MKRKMFLAKVLLLLFSTILLAQVETDAKVGDMAPDFRCEDQNGDIHTLEEFKGKYILIDFWASYCGPCKKELPYLEAIKKEFEDKNITFISISIDYDKDEWRSKLNELKLDGVQLVINRAEIRFIHKYRVETIPRYILLDKEGRIVNINMPRPSDEKMLEILRALEDM